MAIIENGINGAFSGKVGTVVGYIRRGRGVIRSHGKRKAPPTAKELLNREKFAVSQKWLAPLIDFLRIGFKDYQPTFEGFLAGKSYNHKNALQCDEDGVYFINPALALVSHGSLPLPPTASAVSEEGQKIVFTWSKDFAYMYNDYAMVVLYDVEKEFVHYHPALETVPAGTATLALPKEYAGLNFDVYLAFISNDRKNKSNSMYLGKLTVV